jgi:PAS domain S-box-containing protein
MGLDLQSEYLNEVKYSIDRNGIILDLSENIEKLTGYKREELIGQNFRLFVNPDDEKAIFLHFQNALDGIYEPCDFRVTTKSGQQILLRSLCRAPLESEKDAQVDGVLTKV